MLPADERPVTDENISRPLFLRDRGHIVARGSCSRVGPAIRSRTGAVEALEGFAASSPEEERAAFTLPPGFEIELVAAESEGIGKFVTGRFRSEGAAVDHDRARISAWTATKIPPPPSALREQGEGQGARLRPRPEVADRATRTSRASSPTASPFRSASCLTKTAATSSTATTSFSSSDTDGDGKADKRDVILTGFGVQDSHLFPHQFTRAPGGWIWMAQGAFNYSKVRSPDEPRRRPCKFDQTRMARFRPDGSRVRHHQQGPCNIWGLVHQRRRRGVHPGSERLRLSR